jgi:hypothetical protein
MVMYYIQPGGCCGVFRACRDLNSSFPAFPVCGCGSAEILGQMWISAARPFWHPEAMNKGVVVVVICTRALVWEEVEGFRFRWFGSLTLLFSDDWLLVRVSTLEWLQEHSERLNGKGARGVQILLVDPWRSFFQLSLVNRVRQGCALRVWMMIHMDAYYLYQGTTFTLLRLIRSCRSSTKSRGGTGVSCGHSMHNMPNPMGIQPRYQTRTTGTYYNRDETPRRQQPQSVSRTHIIYQSKLTNYARTLPTPPIVNR